jgi:hypothetical protein
MRLPPSSSILVLRSTLLLAGLFVACGRTVLDDPVDITGTAGATGGSVGTAGASGTAGFTTGTAGFAGTAGFVGGTAGAFGTAGFFGGTAGAFGTAGFFGGTAGMAGFFGGTAGNLGMAGFSAGSAGASGTAGNSGCNNGDTECFSATDVGICQGGQWTDAFTCPMGCVNAVCAECKPGTTQCDTGTTEQICGSNGIWSASMLCAGACTNGTCPTVTCVDGATRCTSDQTGLQTCVNGVWASATDCEYVCIGQACVMNLKTVFVTSQVFAGGDIGGLTGADTICDGAAQAAGMPGNYLAWLSDSTGSPATRFGRDGGPYELVDGTEIAHNWTELTQQGLINGITATELDTRPSAANTSSCGPFSVWTDTKDDGTLNDVRFSCDDWSNLMGMGAALGVAGGTLGWTDECMLSSAMTTAPCDQTAALYCFEQ